MPAVVKRILSPDEWRKRQIKNLKLVGEDNYGVGIQSPRKDPIQAGIDAEDKYNDAMKKVLEEERRKAGLEASSMEEWFKYSDEFKDRLVDGVVKREAKVKNFIDKYQPKLLDHVAKIDALDDATDKDREERVLANLRGLKALKGAAR